MALPPTIPTSFVPHSSSPTQRYRSDFTSAFGFFTYSVLGIVFLLALGVFFYGRILASDKLTKDALLAKAEAAIDPATVQGFVQLRNRLNNGVDLLHKHVAFSNFFTALQTLLPTNVRFTSLHISLDPSGIAKLEGAGIAKSFNALAVVSTTFATDDRIKDAIFSHIGINKDNTVSFGLSASLDPKIITFSPESSIVAAPVVPGQSSFPETPAASASSPGALDSLSAPSSFPPPGSLSAPSSSPTRGTPAPTVSPAVQLP